MTSRPTAAIPGEAPLSALSIGGMLLLAVIWGLSIPVTKLGLATMPPLTLTALRFAIALPVLLLLVIGRKRMPWRALPRVAALGVLGIGIGQVTQTLGVTGTSAAVGTVISAAIPVLVVLFAALRLHQRLSPRQFIGLITAFAGIALVAGGNDDGGASTSLAGAVLLLISALAVAFYYVWSVELTEQYGAVTVAAWSTLSGFLALLPWAVWEMSHTPFAVTPEALASAAYLGLLVTAAGLFLWLWLLRTVPARTAAAVQYLQPVIGVSAAALMFGDPLGAFFLAGVLLVLTGLALTMAPRRP